MRFGKGCTVQDAPNDIEIAFDHPLARAEAGGSRPSPDRLSLRDYIVAVEIGAFEVERGETQRLSFNVVVELSPMDSPAEDDVDRILSYDRLIEAVDKAVSAERVSLLETLAESIADRVLVEPQAERVFVRIEKLDRGPFKLGVEIERRAGQGVARRSEAATVAPLVLALSEQAVRGLSDWVDAAERHARPVIIVVPQVSAPSVGEVEAQRRVDFLACDQAAWVAAARDLRLTPRATRTEIDWAAGRGDLTVWAPARLALDAPLSLPAESGVLAAWLADQVGASELVLVGVDVADDRGVPLRRLDHDAANRL